VGAFTEIVKEKDAEIAAVRAKNSELEARLERLAVIVDRCAIEPGSTMMYLTNRCCHKAPFVEALADFAILSASFVLLPLRLEIPLTSDHGLLWILRESAIRLRQLAEQEP